ncbi:uncharacterized protein MELLADRAFT_59185 [Melampsora larici-populina 98AG31]|uniref:Secreted protein n=1 Tax=Melampsora larici-populina (strain 98AG31 / pathotype 3-4-7) TaxID=747676 RepID=F4R5C6_MELLP|nr:uncharacterized protein MELLADRAFT_59185 [Melampsora larici-populina 98AG31]EGG12023.1 secreted protein [Melampsora larici-populina 98AG31]
MKAHQPVFLLFCTLFILVVLAITVPGKLTPEDAENLEWIDLMQSAPQQPIHAQYEFKDLEQPSHQYGSPQTGLLQAHLESIENYLMQDNNWDTSPLNLETDAEDGKAIHNSNQKIWQDAKGESSQNLQNIITASEPTKTLGITIRGFYLY